MKPLKKYRIWLLRLLTAAFVLLMLLSLKFRFLDIFVAGSWHGRIGNDFFSVPRSFLNLLEHKSMFSNTGFSSYGPYGGMYTYHPVLSIFVGFWFALLNPWVSYGLFVFISIAILVYCAFLISKQTDENLIKQFAYFAILCTFPTYLLLWNAQMHVFTVLSVTLIMVSLIEVLSNKNNEKIYRERVNMKLLFGLLFSLFTKPIVILFFPALAFTKETRRTLIVCLLIYASVTAIFLFVPFFNPESDNIMHWKFFIHHSNVGYTGNPESFNAFTAPDDLEFFSLPTFIDNLLDRRLNSAIYKIPVILMFVPSFLILFIKQRNDRIMILLFAIILAIYSFYLSYDRIWEYFYTTLLPTIPIMAILYKNLFSANYKRLLRYLLILSTSFYLPALFFLYRDNVSNYLVLGRIMRVVPVSLIFVILLFLILSMLVTVLVKKEQIISKEANINFT